MITDMMNTYVRINYDGKISSSTFGILQYHCVLDVTYYPFDEQYCAISFVSWILDSSQVDKIGVLPIVFILGFLLLPLFEAP